MNNRTAGIVGHYNSHYTEPGRVPCCHEGAAYDWHQHTQELERCTLYNKSRGVSNTRPKISKVGQAYALSDACVPAFSDGPSVKRRGRYPHISMQVPWGSLRLCDLQLLSMSEIVKF